MKKYQKFIDQKKDIKSLADEEQFMYEVCTVSVCALQLLRLKKQIMDVSSTGSDCTPDGISSYCNLLNGTYRKLHSNLQTCSSPGA